MKIPEDEKDSSTINFMIKEPELKFSRLCISEAIQDQLNEFIFLHKNEDLIYEKWNLKSLYPKAKGRFVLNLSGPSGVGKTSVAEALADSLGLKYMSINYATLESKYVGDTAKNISHAFAEARRNKALIHWDEADTILGRRLTNVTSAADHGVNNARTTMLIELEKHQGPVVFSTNLITNYDPAFERRIDHFISFALPDMEERKKIFSFMLPKEIPTSEDIDINLIAEKTVEFSPADIKKLIFLSAVSAASLKNFRAISNKVLFDAINKIQKGKKAVKGDVKVISEEIVDIKDI